MGVFPRLGSLIEGHESFLSVGPERSISGEGISSRSLGIDTVEVGSIFESSEAFVNGQGATNVGDGC